MYDVMMSDIGECTNKQFTMAPLRSFFIINSGFLPINKIINNQRSILRSRVDFCQWRLIFAIPILQQLTN